MARKKKRARAIEARPPAPEPEPAAPEARPLSTKHRGTLEAIFQTPVRSNIPWRDVEALLEAPGAEITEGAGSRVRCLLGGRVVIFHRPHPEKETGKGAVKSVRRYLVEVGVVP